MYENQYGRQDREMQFWEQRAAQLRAGTDWLSTSGWHSTLASLLGPQADINEAYRPALLEMLASSAAAAMADLQSGAIVEPSVRAGLASLLGLSPFATASEVKYAYAQQQDVRRADSVPLLAAGSETECLLGASAQPCTFGAAASISDTTAAASGGTATGTVAGSQLEPAPESSASSSSALAGAAQGGSEHAVGATAAVAAAASTLLPASAGLQPEAEQPTVCTICMQHPVTHGFLHRGS